MDKTHKCFDNWAVVRIFVAGIDGTGLVTEGGEGGKDEVGCDN